ncbi:hypothetical protein MMC13_002345 [Lambiella insularis]|nr:hypothetical protein [Lambiella insularis]
MPSTSASPPSPSHSSPLPLPPPQRIPLLPNVLLPHLSLTIPHDIHISPSTALITSITPSPNPTTQTPSLCLPSLCHPHIHLDKAHLYSHPSFAHLVPDSGSFPEALALTSRAKALFTPADLLARGNWLLHESLCAGVTHLRAFVEADTTAGVKGIEAGLELRRLWRGRCEVQVCVFAQEAVFSGGEDGEGRANREVVERALGMQGVEAVGSTPYVEADEGRAKRNVEWVVELAVSHGFHLDLHLDYHLDAGREPLVWFVLEMLRSSRWVERNAGKTVCLGHCTRLTLFGGEEWQRLRKEVEGLPVYFVGLPTSDLFMMGRPEGGGEERDRVRGTLQVPSMVQKLGLKAVLGVNNVGNAFTPWGSADPLSLAALGVGIYQAGTERDAEVLYECVSTRAKEAIGLGESTAQIKTGDKADLVVFGKREGIVTSLYRWRRTVKEIVYDAGRERTVIKAGFWIPLE